ncbi:MAG: MATE family efflux transporter [Clostridia bacterium]|nr:MATE family efflux transporter [Clostridia bacterium]
MSKSYPGFLRTMLSLAIPVTLQNLLFSSFTLVDTLMIGRLGDTQLAAVGMAGKWSWFLSIVFFGCASGAGVFIAQYFGAGNTKGIHRTYGLMTILTLLASAVFMLAGVIAPQAIVSMFTSDPEAIRYGASYLRIIALCYPFQAISRSGSMLLQSTQKPTIPFIGAACSVAANVVLNALLIFGLCGFPALGVEGAAIATALSAVLNTVVIYFIGLRQRTLLCASVSDMLDIRGGFVKDYLRIAAPTLFNETTWSLGILVYSAIFGHMSTEAYAAVTVVRSIEDLMCVAIFGMGASCAAMIGSLIGRGEIDRAKYCAKAHLVFVEVLSVVIGVVVLLLRGPIIALFGVSESVGADAAVILAIYASVMWLRNIPYMLVVGIFRAGGDTKYALYVDFAAAYLLGIPLTALSGLVLHWSLPVTYLIMYVLEDILKVFLYGTHYLSGKWIKPVV